MNTPEIPMPKTDNAQFHNHWNIPMISCQQLAAFIENPSSFDQILILDARFNYEFKGGHIIGARNVINRNQIQNIYNICSGQNTCVICYGERSQARGPTLYQMIRQYDRENHCADYPNLTIPNLYVLESGYESFYNNCPALCVGGFTHMRDQ